MIFKQRVIIYSSLALQMHFLKLKISLKFTYRVVVLVYANHEDDLTEDHGGGQVLVEGRGSGG